MLTPLLERVDELIGTRGGQDGLTGWFCIRVTPWECQGCGRSIVLASVSPDGKGHLIVVWPSKEDPNLGRTVERLEGKGEQTKVVEFRASLGDPVSYYALPSLGDPEIQ